MLFRTSLIAMLTTAAGLVATASPPAEAGGRFWRTPPQSYPNGYVIAHSRFGNGSISGAVRPAQFGYQVRLPHGTWVDCRRSCAETLRVETIDYWEGPEVGGGTMLKECGIFGCLDIRF